MDFDAEVMYEQYEVFHNGEYCWTNTLTRLQFHNVVKAMGWACIAEFIAETGVEYDDIKGRYWMVCGNPTRVFIVG